MDATLLKGLRVLEMLATTPHGRGVTDLALELELPKSNVHRTLQTLVTAGYVTSTGAGQYECTLKLFELGNHVADRFDIRAHAQPVMRELAELTRETVHLSVLDELDVIYLHKIDSPEPVRAYSRIGGRAPAHCVASGKALLAYQDPHTVVLPESFPAHTERSLTTTDDLIAELSDVRRSGFAVNRGEWRDQVGGIAAIVLDHAGKPTASIGISGPLHRMDLDNADHLDAVMSSAQQISELLGCRDYHARISTWKDSG